MILKKNKMNTKNKFKRQKKNFLFNKKNLLKSYIIIKAI